MSIFSSYDSVVDEKRTLLAVIQKGDRKPSYISEEESELSKRKKKAKKKRLEAKKEKKRKQKEELVKSYDELIEKYQVLFKLLGEKDSIIDGLEFQISRLYENYKELADRVKDEEKKRLELMKQLEKRKSESHFTQTSPQPQREVVNVVSETKEKSSNVDEKSVIDLELENLEKEKREFEQKKVDYELKMQKERELEREKLLLKNEESKKKMEDALQKNAELKELEKQKNEGKKEKEKLSVKDRALEIEKKGPLTVFLNPKMEDRINFYIKKYKMKPYKTGGWISTMYESGNEVIFKEETKRRSCVSVQYFLIKSQQFLPLVRFKKQNVMIHFYEGNEMKVWSLHEETGKMNFKTFGNINKNFQLVIHSNTWFALEQHFRTFAYKGYSLIGIACSPQYDIEDVEFADRIELTKKFPRWEKQIKTLTQDKKE